MGENMYLHCNHPASEQRGDAHIILPSHAADFHFYFFAIINFSRSRFAPSDWQIRRELGGFDNTALRAAQVSTKALREVPIIVKDAVC
jgi:hypothetical protein